MPLLHALASTALFLALLPALLLHPRLRGGLRERLGLYPRGLAAAPGRPRVWLHGASAGDVLALAPVVEELRRRRPDAFIAVTTITDSGRAMARRRLAAADAVLYAPYDVPFAARRAVRRLAPDLLVLEYAELWPALLRAARRAGARIALVDGRLDARKLGRYRALFRAVGNPLAALDLLLMRTEADAARARALGAPAERVRVGGNAKLDALPGEVDPARAAALREAMGLEPGAPILLAGSTHAGEEALLLDAYRRLLAGHPGLRLVVAPRYLQRAGPLLARAARAGLSARRRSAGPAAGPAQVIVLDTVGELAEAYALATVAFVGGSFVRRGGQNVLEPAAQGRPVLFGPRMESFEDCLPILLGHGGIQVGSREALEREAGELLARPGRAAELGRQAREAVARARGAARRHVDALLPLAEGER